MRVLVVCIVLVCCISACSAKAVRVSDIAGRTFQSRSCENVAGFLFLKRVFTFTDDEWTLRVLFHTSQDCDSVGGEMLIQGPYELLSDSSAQVPYTEVTLGNFKATSKQLTPLVDEFTFFFNSLSSCWPSDTFQTGAAVDVVDIHCDALGLESSTECPSGELDVIAFYHDALFFGDRNVGAPMCELPRPSLLASFGLVEEGDADILYVPREVTHASQVSPLLAMIDMDRVMNTIERLSSYHTRYYSTATGEAAALELHGMYEQAAECGGNHVEVELFENSKIEPGYRQPSVIGRLKGSGSAATGDVLVVVGGHIDSAVFFDENGESTFVDDGTEDPRWGQGRAPGADDDLSGSAMLLEVFRVLVASGFRPERTVEFHAYAGEERGLVDGKVKGKSGSELLARRLRNEGTEVAAMMNFDSIGSPLTPANCNPLEAELNSLVVFGDPSEPAGRNIDGRIRDLYVDCITAFAESPYRAQLGPNGASDHLSFIGWNLPAAGAVESNIVENGLNGCGFDKQRHHTSRDTIDGVDRNYLRQFARATVGFVVEASFVPSDRVGDVKLDPRSCTSASGASSLRDTSLIMLLMAASTVLAL